MKSVVREERRDEVVNKALKLPRQYLKSSKHQRYLLGNVMSPKPILHAVVLHPSQLGGVSGEVDLDVVISRWMRKICVSLWRLRWRTFVSVQSIVHRWCEDFCVSLVTA